MIVLRYQSIFGWAVKKMRLVLDKMWFLGRIHKYLLEGVNLN